MACVWRELRLRRGDLLLERGGLGALGRQARTSSSRRRRRAATITTSRCGRCGSRGRPSLGRRVGGGGRWTIRSGGRRGRRRRGGACAPPVALGAFATASAAFSKNMTSSKSGRLPLPHGIALRCWRDAARRVARCSRSWSSSDFASVTRVTPSMSCRRASRRATSVWPGAQPWSVIAGALIAPRSWLDAPPAPPAPLAVSPVSGLQRDVGRNGAREVAQDLLPIEARAGDVLDGLRRGPWPRRRSRRTA